MSLGLGSSAQWGCSLAVNVEGLAASQQDGGGPRESGGAMDAGMAPDVQSPSPAMDANENDSTGTARDGHMHEGERDGQSNPVDGGASETMATVDDAGSNEEMDATTMDAPGGEEDAHAPDTMIEQPDAEAADISPGDLSTEGGGGSGGSADAAPEVGGDADSDAHPLACAASPAVSATLELANAPSAETACGYVPAEVPRFYAAVDPTVFNGSAACGACVIIETPAGRVEARVVDSGPAASRPNPTAVAVSRPAMTALAPDGSTLVNQGVDWHFTPCTLTSPGMTFKIQTGSNANYAGVLVENHRHRLTKVEYKIRAIYYPLARSTYNYWIASQGMGTGPFTLRLTDDLGQTVEQTGIPLAPGKVFRGEAQFPACSP